MSGGESCPGKSGRGPVDEVLEGREVGVSADGVGVVMVRAPNRVELLLAPLHQQEPKS